MIGELVLLPSEGTFEYRGIVSANSIKSTEIIFQVHDLGGVKEKRLVGHAPWLSIWKEQLILIPDSHEFASYRLVELPVGTVIKSIVKVGDEIES